MKTLTVWFQGFKDGWESPSYLSMGMTYDDYHLNETYDKGVNFGQKIGAWFKNVPCQNVNE